MTNEQIQALKAADASRIADCVNACEGISTENLVNNVPLKQGLAGLNKRIRDAETQRDELLAEREADKALIAELGMVNELFLRAKALMYQSGGTPIENSLNPIDAWLYDAESAAGITLKVGGEDGTN